MKKPQKIVLLGYMGSGKTQVGKELAKKLKLPFIDLDAYITEQENLSIVDIFEEKGDSYFREKEFIYLKELLVKEESFVLALGGGTPQIEGVMPLLNQIAFSVYLKASTETLTYRLLPETVERPLLTLIEEDYLHDYIDSHLSERKKFYEQANIFIKVDNKTIEEIVKEISKEIISKIS